MEVEQRPFALVIGSIVASHQRKCPKLKTIFPTDIGYLYPFFLAF